MFNWFMNWVNAARWHKSASHCIEGALIYMPMTVISCLIVMWLTNSLQVALHWAPWVGTVAVIVWYWSREKVEYEFSRKVPGASTVSVWSIGWFPWEWDLYSQMDLFLPAVSSILVSVLWWVIVVKM